jgi:hypothetical protein
MKNESTMEEQQSLKLCCESHSSLDVSMQESLQNIGRLWFRMGRKQTGVGRAILKASNPDQLGGSGRACS